MNATAELSQFAEAAETIRRDVLTPAAIAHATGHPVSTISRDRAQKALIDWRARDLLLLVRSCPELLAALIAYCQGHKPERGDDRQVPVDLVAEVRATSRVAEAIRIALADQRLTVREIDDVLDELAFRRRVDATLARDLRALRRTSRP